MRRKEKLFFIFLALATTLFCANCANPASAAIREYNLKANQILSKMVTLQNATYSQFTQQGQTFSQLRSLRGMAHQLDDGTQNQQQAAQLTLQLNVAQQVNACLQMVQGYLANPAQDPTELAAMVSLYTGCLGAILGFLPGMGYAVMNMDLPTLQNYAATVANAGYPLGQFLSQNPSPVSYTLNVFGQGLPPLTGVSVPNPGVINDPNNPLANY